MPTAWQRDLVAARAALEGWLRGKLQHAQGLEVSELTAPQASGFSNETLLFDLGYFEGGQRRSESLVVRIEPTGFQVFPEYDMRAQFECMRLLARVGVPVPAMRWLEAEDRSVLGAAFYVMARVAGRAAADRPLYTMEGWLKEATPAEQAHGLELCAHVVLGEHLVAGRLDAHDE